MTKLRTLGPFAQFIFLAIFTVSASTQQSGAGQALSNPSPTVALRGASQLLQRAPGPARAGAQGDPSRRLQGKKADSGGVSFQPAVNYFAGGQYPLYGVWSLAVGDINGDGKADIMVTNFNGAGNTWDATHGAYTVLLGNGDGTFQAAQTTYLSQGTSYLAIGDVNGDGKPDLIISSCCETNNDGQVAVLLGNGDGTFRSPVTYDSGAGAGGVGGSVALLDLSGNGKLDIVTVNWGGSVAVLMGNGDGTFQPAVTYPVGYNAEGLGVGDFNQDGNLDVVVVDCCGGYVSILLGNGDGTFQPQIYSDIGSCEQQTLAVGDLNGDGIPDLVTAIGGPSSCGTDGVAGVSLGNGQGGFSALTYYDAGGYSPVSPVITDINGDGVPDVLLADGCGTSEGCANSNAGTVAVLLGNGDGTLQSPVTFQTGGSSGFSAGSLAVADLSGNGKPDLVVANLVQNTVGVLMNSAGLAATSTTLASSLNPSSYGQSVTFTAAVTASSGTPAGTVIFYNGSTQIGSATLSGGNALLSTSSLPVGSDPITAAYQGSGGFATSTSGVLSQQVLAATTTYIYPIGSVDLTQPVTFTAVVSSSSGTPTGTVIFNIHPPKENTYQVPATLNAGAATYTTSFAKAGSGGAFVTYQGNSNFGGSSSSAIGFRVIDRYVTSTTIASSLNPSSSGQAVTFTATVSSDHGAIPDGETVKFTADRKEIGTASITNGVAVLTTSSLAAGTYTVEVSYSGDRIFGRSSGSLTQVVTAYSTTTTLTSSLNPSTYGQTVTWTAAVTSNGGPAPMGKVKFAGLGAAATLNASGVATFTKTWLNASTYAITAEYEGDDASAPSNSATLSQVVNPTATTTTVTSSANPSTLGQSVTFTARVKTSTAVNSAGTVTFTAGGTTLGTATLSANVASVSTSALPVGTTVVQAIYSGETNFTGSSGTVTQTVNP